MHVVRVDHMILGAVLGARTLILLPTTASASLGRSGRYYRLPLCNTRRNFNRLGTWNVRGINDTTKREEVVDILKKRKVRFASLGRDEIERGVRGIMG